jgi:hypothetical protein
MFNKAVSGKITVPEAGKDRVRHADVDGATEDAPPASVAASGLQAAQIEMLSGQLRVVSFWGVGTNLFACAEAHRVRSGSGR